MSFTLYYTFTIIEAFGSRFIWLAFPYSVQSHHKEALLSVTIRAQIIVSRGPLRQFYHSICPYVLVMRISPIYSFFAPQRASCPYVLYKPSHSFLIPAKISPLFAAKGSWHLVGSDYSGISAFSTIARLKFKVSCLCYLQTAVFSLLSFSLMTHRDDQRVLSYSLRGSPQLPAIRNLFTDASYSQRQRLFKVFLTRFILGGKPLAQ